MSESVSEKITIGALKQLFPIRNLSEEILESFAEGAKLEIIPAGTTLFNLNHPANCAIYLLDGRVELLDQNGKKYEISAGSSHAKFPICSGVKHTASAIAKTRIGILRVSLSIMTATNRTEHSALEIPEEFRGNRLLMMFANHFQDHELEIPSLPEVAINLRKAIEKDIGIAEAAKIIQLDPVITAKLVEVANCPLYITQYRASNCLDAVKRIGLKATRSLVISLSTKQLFRTKSQLLKHHLETQWRHSLYLSILCHILATNCQQKNPEDALLAGLVCDIGILPFLSFVANLPAEFINDYEIKQAIPVLRGVVGEAVLREWDFPEEFLEVVRHSCNWFQNSSDELTLTDIVVLSRLHAQIGKKEAGDVPSIFAIPATSKLKNLEMSPENSLAILHNAKTKIHSALSILSN